MNEESVVVVPSKKASMFGGGFKQKAFKASRDKAAKLAEEAAAAEEEAASQLVVIAEEEAIVERMPNGAKKMLKVKALKAAQMVAQKKAEEAEALREDATEAQAEVMMNQEAIVAPSSKKASMFGGGFKQKALKASRENKDVEERGAPIYVSIRMDTTLEEYHASRDSVTAELQASLGLEDGQFDIISVSLGSVILTFSVMARPGETRSLLKKCRAIAGNEFAESGISVTSVEVLEGREDVPQNSPEFLEFLASLQEEESSPLQDVPEEGVEEDTNLAPSSKKASMFGGGFKQRALKAAAAAELEATNSAAGAAEAAAEALAEETLLNEAQVWSSLLAFPIPPYKSYDPVKRINPISLTLTSQIQGGRRRRSRWL